MKIIRPFQSADMEVAKTIHARYWEEEFGFPDFSRFDAVYTTVDQCGDIIAVGGVRPIYECIVITDLEKSGFVRRGSYFNILHACSRALRDKNITEVHAFVQGDRWVEVLKNMGFHDTVGRALVLEI